MQKMIRIEGKLSGCPNCDRQPFLHKNLANGEHFFECYPCRFRMYPMPTAQQAIEIWEDLKRPEPVAEIVAESKTTDAAQTA